MKSKWWFGALVLLIGNIAVGIAPEEGAVEARSVEPKPQSIRVAVCVQ